MILAVAMAHTLSQDRTAARAIEDKESMHWLSRSIERKPLKRRRGGKMRVSGSTTRGGGSRAKRGRGVIARQARAAAEEFFPECAGGVVVLEQAARL